MCLKSHQHPSGQGSTGQAEAPCAKRLRLSGSRGAYIDVYMYMHASAPGMINPGTWGNSHYVTVLTLEEAASDSNVPPRTG